jgi:nitroreductase
MLRELVLKNRSYRRFDTSIPLKREKILQFIDTARFVASAGNLQPLKYYVSSEESTNSLIFSCLKWAVYLKNWSGPKKSEQPTAYIVIIKRDETGKDVYCDAGIAAQTILLSATEEGFGGTIIRTIDKDILTQNLNFSSSTEILLVIALGKPKEDVVLDQVKENGEIKYWRDENNVHHVPKRTLDDILIS